MMSVMRVKPATADCNHLMNKDRLKFAAGEQSDTSQDADSSQKPRKHLQTIESKGDILHEVTNMNNNKAVARCHVLNQGDLFDDVPHSHNTVPVPVAWSPGMFFKSNPLLMITPQKTSLSTNGPFLSTKENILEPQSANKIPQPAAWSPGMKVQPDPNLFITPERVYDRKIIARVRSYDRQTTDGDARDERQTTDSGRSDGRQTTDSGRSDGRQTTETTSCGIQNIPARTKNLYTVRFDLPSSTSEDESKDMLSETDSPITIRGRDLDVKEFGFGSPDLKSFGLQKSYNPGMYSDDSSLDESVLNSLPKTSVDKRKTKQSSGITKSISDNSNVWAYVGSDLPNCTPGVTDSVSNDAKPNKHTEADKNFAKTANKDTQISVSRTLPQRLKPKSDTSVNMVMKVPHERKKLPVGGRIVATADHPSSHLSSTESPPEGSLVIREMKNHLLSTKYSFPFELAATAEDCEYEHVFARPEFNSTLAMREQLDNLHDQKVDVMKAVQASLAKSEIKRSELNEKAAGFTNRVSGQFTNLIDLNTSVESLCDRVVRMRTSKVPSKRRVPRTDKKFSESQRAPDLMEFFTSDLLKEYPDVTLPNVTQVTSQLMTSPPELSFDLYRHNRLWQGISDF